MTTVKELCRPADFEIRANTFIRYVRRASMEIDEANGYGDYFDVTVEKALEKGIESLGKVRRGFKSELVNLRLASLLNILRLNNSDLEMFADELDRHTANCCEVEVHAYCWVKELLFDFVKKVLNLADKQGGILDNNFSVLSTEREEDFILQLKDDSNPYYKMFVTDLFFSF